MTLVPPSLAPSFGPSPSPTPSSPARDVYGELLEQTRAASGARRTPPAPPGSTPSKSTRKTNSCSSSRCCSRASRASRTRATTPARRAAFLSSRRTFASSSTSRAPRSTARRPTSRALLGVSATRRSSSTRYVETVQLPRRTPTALGNRSRWRRGPPRRRGDARTVAARLAASRSPTCSRSRASASFASSACPTARSARSSGSRIVRSRCRLHFNPLAELEIRPEFDRITSPGVLESIESVPGGHARRLVALTFLSLFRMLRYLALIDAVASSGAEGRAARHGGHRVSRARRLLPAPMRGPSRRRSRAARGGSSPRSYERHLFRVPAPRSSKPATTRCSPKDIA